MVWWFLEVAGAGGVTQVGAAGGYDDGLGLALGVAYDCMRGRECGQSPICASMAPSPISPIYASMTSSPTPAPMPATSDLFLFIF